MHKNNIPVKVSIGYAAVAIIMVLAIALVYGNTKSIIAINQASKEYIAKKNTADSTMTRSLKRNRKTCGSYLMPWPGNQTRTTCARR